MALRALALAALLLPSACAHRVVVATAPAGALVVEGDRRLGVTPVEIRVRPSLRARRVVVELAGYRPMETKLAWRPFRRRSTRELRLVEEHGGVGTWDPEDAD